MSYSGERKRSTGVLGKIVDVLNNINVLINQYILEILYYKCCYSS